MNKIWIGTSGFNYRSWRGDFYPQDTPLKNWLSYYATQFKTVEINATFYGSFKKETYEKWCDTVPADFTFAIKGPRYITHLKRLSDIGESLDIFFEVSHGLREKLGVVLWQFPPSFRFEEETKKRLADFIGKLPKDIHQVFEFRHKTWFADEVYALLDKLKVGIVISESSRFPSEEVVTGKVCYIRFHGPERLYSSGYSKQQLEEWGEKIRGWAKKSTVYCYFNNDNGGYAFENAAELASIVAQEGSLSAQFI